MPPAQLAELSRAAHLSPAQSSLLASAAAPGAGPAANVVALALARDSALSHLAMRLQQAGVAGSSAQGAAGPGLPAGSAQALVAPLGAAAAEQLLLRLFASLPGLPGGQLRIGTEGR